MANIDKQDFLWNGKLSGAVNLIYTDLLNVDVVKPPYSWYPRNSSYFLQTRLGYIAESDVQEYVYNHTENNSNRGPNYKVSDVEIIWKDNCENREGTVAMLIYNEDETELMVIGAPIKCLDKDHPCVIVGCLKSFIDEDVFDNGIRPVPRDSDKGCFNPKLFRTNSGIGRNALENVLVGSALSDLGNGIQENRIEGGVTRGYFTTEQILNSSDDAPVRWARGLEGKYITITSTYDTYLSSPRLSNVGIPGQTRMILGYSDDDKYLMLDNAWVGFEVPDGSVQQKNYCNWAIFDEEGEVFGLSIGMRLITMAPYNTMECGEDIAQSAVEYTPSRGNIISTVDSNGRLFSLYDNGWVKYSTFGGRDKFYYDDEVYVGEDKIVLCSYRDCVIAFGRNKTTVLVPTEFQGETYFYAYEQSSTIGLKSRYAFGEHDGHLLFVSNDNRLFTIGILETSGKYMLGIEDIGQDIINSKLSLMYESDEVFVGDYGNELKILVQSKPNPSKPNSNNSETHIYKLDSIFKVWTEDHLENILIDGYKYGIYFGSGGIYLRGLVEQDGSGDWYISENGRDGIAMDFRISPELIGEIPAPSSYETPNRVVANISAFMTENEVTGLTSNVNGTSTGAPDLFSMIKLNRLAVTLGYGKYSEQTKIKITAYREGIGEVTEIPIPQTNAWIEMVTGSYMQKPINPDIVETKRCLLDTIQAPQHKYEQDGETVERKVEDLVNDTPRCESKKRINYQNHNIDIDSSIYELAPHKPIVVGGLSDTQNYSSQIKVEIISESGDVLNFGGLLAELFIAPTFYQGADGENLIEMGSC